MPYIIEQEYLDEETGLNETQLFGTWEKRQDAIDWMNNQPDDDQTIEMAVVYVNVVVHDKTRTRV